MEDNKEIFLKEHLEPVLRELEEKRQEEYNSYLELKSKFQKKIFLWLACLCLTVAFFFFVSYQVSLENKQFAATGHTGSYIINAFYYYILIFLSGFICVFGIGNTLIKLRHTAFPFGLYAKQKIIPALLSYFDPSFKYLLSGRLPFDELQKFSGLIPITQNAYTEDYFEGSYQGHDIKFHELQSRYDIPYWLDITINGFLRIGGFRAQTDGNWLLLIPVFILGSILFIFSALFAVYHAIDPRKNTLTYNKARVLCFFSKLERWQGEGLLTFKKLPYRGKTLSRLNRAPLNNGLPFKLFSNDDQIIKLLNDEDLQKHIIKTSDVYENAPAHLYISGHEILFMICDAKDMFEIGNLNKAVSLDDVNKVFTELEAVFMVINDVILRSKNI